MKVFIAHKMSGLTEKEVANIRRKARTYLMEKYKNDIVILDNYHHDDAPKDAGRLWHLGKSIQLLEQADAVYFVKGRWMNAKGCWVERFIAFIYRLRTLR